MREQAKVCSNCGTRAEEWDEDPDAYYGQVERCHGCAEMAAELKDFEESGGDTKGIRTVLVAGPRPLDDDEAD